MVHGSWLKAHGQGRPLEAPGSWPDAAPALGTQRRAGPDRILRNQENNVSEVLEGQMSRKKGGMI